MRPAAALLPILLSLLPLPALACGPDTDCPVGERSYRLYLPEGLEGKEIGALVFAHGYRGTAAGVMKNMAFRALADDLGVALIALQAAGEDWQLAHTPRAPDREEALEYDYVRAVLEDAGQRLHLDPARTVATGFSAGGMMTWTLACGMSESFAGFVPMSGTFWAPVPGTCTTPPASVVHIHGTEDTTVPLGGRPIGPARQGDVPETLAMYSAYGDFTPTGQHDGPDGMSCRRSTNPAGRMLEFCTFPGGHSFSTLRLGYAYRRILGE
ncbi:alpha/beta hydrolase family esterase [Oceaniglobus roseus]|uniref:alpha/beta hydrolase family esterase n=1 Tax=Oceaniglobus roseus TaxID=1737570 RepID=UPI000C7E964C|nr:PHB depolymerase family esterase [Kandeliimicrobium roseum]